MQKINPLQSSGTSFNLYVLYVLFEQPPSQPYNCHHQLVRILPGDIRGLIENRTLALGVMDWH